LTNKNGLMLFYYTKEMNIHKHEIYKIDNTFNDLNVLINKINEL